MSLRKIFMVAMAALLFGVLAGDSGSVFAGPVKKGPKANAPAVELAPIIKKWQKDRLDSDQVRKIVMEQYVKTWQRVNVTGVVKGTKNINVLPALGMPRKASKNTKVTKLEYYQKGGFTFEVYVVLPEGVSFPYGDKLRITNAHIESNRGYRRPAVKLVLINGEVEQLPPD